ncbi:MAG: cysteine synthase A [Pseudomonadota bacterium]
MTYPDFIGAIGNTPLVRLHGPSKKTGCEILAKLEFANPGGSIKDRAALAIIQQAEKSGALRPGGLIVEGTAGNTGIGITLVANAKGYKTVIVMPRTQSQEKQDALRMIGADLRLVDAVPYKDPGNYVRVAERLSFELAEQTPNGVIWANQFDNCANREIHRDTTAQEIWRQTSGQVDAFTCAVGTGGTLAGVAEGLRAHNKDVKIILTDPMGSALFSHYTSGKLASEGNSISEGIGQGRVTGNLEGLHVDGAQQVTDEQALPVTFDLLREEGWCVGLSSGINVCGAIQVAHNLGPGHTIVTLLCDSGYRYASKIFNPVFLRAKNLPTPPWLD